MIERYDFEHIPVRKTRKAICEERGLSRQFLDKVIKGLRTYPARYPKGVIQSGHMTLIDTDMMDDWIDYREALKIGAPCPNFERAAYRVQRT